MPMSASPIRPFAIVYFRTSRASRASISVAGASGGGGDTRALGGRGRTDKLSSFFGRSMVNEGGGLFRITVLYTNQSTVISARRIVHLPLSLSLSSFFRPGPRGQGWGGLLEVWSLVPAPCWILFSWRSRFGLVFTLTIDRPPGRIGFSCC